ncbi:MAG: hypothetical protein HYZ49_01265 [Chloroflexi bacterium]|nr:hypothetical protein [Chloroflexota bacterium]
MGQQEASSDFELLATITRHIRPEFDELDEAWEGSPFAWVRKLPSASRGKMGKRMVAAWCAAKGLMIDSSNNSEADLLLNGHRVEIKFSTLWKSGIYKFQQIREQDYEYAVCLGVSPFQAHCWVVSKALLRKQVIGHKPQHKGVEGTDTFWFSVDPNKPPEWIANSGGTLDQAFQVLKSLSRKRN